jgi:hypothetical protein
MNHHIDFTAEGLREAYEQADALPLCGGWREKKGGQEYRCPLNLIYGVSTEKEAAEAAGIPLRCVNTFILSWDGCHPQMPEDCAECWERGRQLAAAFEAVFVLRGRDLIRCERHQMD